MTPDGKRVSSTTIPLDSEANENEEKRTGKPANEDDFFELLTKSQSKRMDDQRCSLKVLGVSVDTAVKEPSVRKPLVPQNTNNNSVQQKEGSRLV